jgi:hypothetical protein
MIPLRTYLNLSFDYYLQKVSTVGWLQHLHHRGLLQEGEGQALRASEVHEETQKKVSEKPSNNIHNKIIETISNHYGDEMFSKQLSLVKRIDDIMGGKIY